MSIYSTNGYLFGEAPYIPPVKVKDWKLNVIPKELYVGGGSSGSNGSAEERQTIFQKLDKWLTFFPHTKTKLLASDPAIVSNDDLLFILDVTTNMSQYYPVGYTSNPASIAAFFLEVVAYIMLGETPANAQKKAYESMATGKFVSTDPYLVEFSKMSSEEKEKSDNVFSQSGVSGYTEQPGKGGTEPAKTSNRTLFVIIAGIAVIILSTK